MAQVIAQDSVWYLKTANRDLRTLDLVALSTGKIGFAVGGSTGGSGVIYSGLYDLTTVSLGVLRENLLSGDASGGRHDRDLSHGQFRRQARWQLCPDDPGP